MKAWTKEGKHYRRKLDGRDDLIYNDMVKIVWDKDVSEWAYECFEACADLLIRRVRFPDYMKKDTDAKTIIGWWFYHKVLQRIFPKLKGKTRCQKDMTRDPYIAFYRCAVHLNREQLIACIKPPIRLWRPEFLIWRRRLLKEHRLNYVERLRHLRVGAEYEQGERAGIYDEFCGIDEY